ncbi:Up in starvation [Paramarasmius palmivorus]|uniref:Up in starvation n=1 Tax=Paramarasmius palmivorus TaxID=297713 RepID=A0AAW0BU13_9AGAR
MATAAVLTQQQQGPGVNKRYRPTPAKTFQCRGYGECRMVFSRSEHLARHIRKHTGERPFTCHCGKQFSRLDNLRQHAQTVHSDKQDQNERMMRDLTSLHASMAAANKATSRGGRRAAGTGAGNGTAGIVSVAAAVPQIKVEDGGRPGTSTGYEGANWQISQNPVDDNNSFRDQHHSFRDQSFRDNHSVSPVSPASPISNAAGPSRGSGGGSFRASQHHSPTGLQQQQSPQSFLPPFSSHNYPVASSAAATTSSRFSFNVPPPNSSVKGSESSSSRPTTATHQGNGSGTVLPPLSSVVPTSIPPPPPSSSSRPGSSHILPPSAGLLSNATTSTTGSSFPYPNFGWARPGTAPSSLSFPGPPPPSAAAAASATAFSFSSPYTSQLVGRSSAAASVAAAADGADSPFSFNLPPPTTTTSRKRSFSTANEDDDGGESSRPTSRRLTVMELCSNDPAPSSDIRPTTTSTITRRAAGLSLSHSYSSNSQLFSPIETPTTGTIEESRGLPSRVFERRERERSPQSYHLGVSAAGARSRYAAHGRSVSVSSSSSASAASDGLRSPVSSAGSPVAVYR